MQIRVYATLRPVVGNATVDLDAGPGDTVRTLLDEMIERYPVMGEKVYDEDGQVSPYIHVYLNGRDIRYLDGADTVIPEDAELRVFPSVGGG